MCRVPCTLIVGEPEPRPALSSRNRTRQKHNCPLPFTASCSALSICGNIPRWRVARLGDELNPQLVFSRPARKCPRHSTPRVFKFLFIFTFGFSSQKDADCFRQRSTVIKSSMESHVDVC